MEKKNLKMIIGMMVNSCQMACYLAVVPVLADIAESFPGVNFEYIQMISTLPWIFAVIVSYFTGKITYKIYKKTLSLASIGFMFAGGICQYLFHYNFLLILLGAAVVGIGIGLMLSTTTALILDYFHGKAGAFLMGLQSSFIGLGGLLFNWLGGLLGKTGWENVYFSYLLLIIIFIISAILLPKGRIATDYETEKNIAEVNDKDNSMKIPGQVWFMAIAGFFYFVFLGIFNSNISMIIKIRGIGGAVESSYAAMSYTLIGIVMGVFAGPIIHKIGKKIFVYIMLLGAAGLLTGFLSGSVFSFCISGILTGAAFCLHNPSANYITEQCTTEKNRDASISTFVSIASLGSALSPLIISYCFSTLDIAGRFLGGAVGFLILAVIYFITGLKRKT